MCWPNFNFRLLFLRMRHLFKHGQKGLVKKCMAIIFQKKYECVWLGAIILKILNKIHWNLTFVCKCHFRNSTFVLPSTRETLQNVSSIVTVIFLSKIGKISINFWRKKYFRLYFYTCWSFKWADKNFKLNLNWSYIWNLWVQFQIRGLVKQKTLRLKNFTWTQKKIKCYGSYN